MPLSQKLDNLTYAFKWHDPVAPDRINWALSDLKLDGLINSPKRGVYKISPPGDKMLTDHDLIEITAILVHSQPAYIEHKRGL